MIWLNVKWFDCMLNSMHDLSTLHVLNTYGMVLSVSICLRFLFVGKFTFHKHDYILLEHLSINAKVIWIFSFSKVWVERWVERKVWCCSLHISRISVKRPQSYFVIWIFSVERKLWWLASHLTFCPSMVQRSEPGRTKPSFARPRIRHYHYSISMSSFNVNISW